MPSKLSKTLLSFASAALLGCALTPKPAQAETDFGQVAMYVAQMLQRHHYNQQKFDDDVSERLLNNYLNLLDFSHLYFTQEDIDAFREAYSKDLDDRILFKDISPAMEIYEAYEKRVNQRFELVKRLLEEKAGNTDFTSNKKIYRSRKDRPWPANEAEAERIWGEIIENNLLEEHLTELAKAEAERERIEKAGKKAAEKEAGENIGKEATPDTPKPEQKAVADETTAEERILKRYEQVLRDLDDTNEEEIANYFLSSLAQAYDPHSEYFSQSELENFEISMKNELVGIGALLSKDEGGAAEIQGLVVGGPADKAGDLENFDRIVGVAQGLEGEMVDVTFMKLQKIVELIRGKKGSTVRLKVNPAKADDPGITTEIVIRRDTVKLKDKLANAELIEVPAGETPADGHRRIGWVNLSSFYADMEGGTTSTTTDIRKLVKRLKDENIEGLVLDLRGNPGGSLEEAINLTGLFIERGPVVQQKDWTGDTSYRSSRAAKPLYDGPMVVLTDRTSASASEILAAALQDYNRAVIVGESASFGKGTVQTIMPVARYMPFFSDKERAGALKVTIQKFYRIAGGSTQLRGVIPDIITPSVRDALDIGEEALEHPLGYDEIEPRPFTVVNKTLPIDEMRGRFQSRIKESPEFAYIIEDTKRLKGRIDENTVSLNKELRLAEREENKVRSELRNDERHARNEAIEAAGKADSYKIYKLTLDNVEKELVSSADFSEEDSTGMRMGEKDEDDEDAPAEYPYKMEPFKLEALNIIRDLIDLTAAERTAKAKGSASKEG